MSSDRISDRRISTSLWKQLEDFMYRIGVEPTMENAVKLLRESKAHKFTDDCRFDDAGSYCYEHCVYVI